MDKIKKILLNILLVCSLIAIIDILFMKSGLFGSSIDYISGNYTLGLWSLFLKIALLTMFSFSLIYYLYFKDLSESLSILFGSYIMWAFGGLSDLLFFIFQGISIPNLPWLFNHLGVGTISKFIGLHTVTPFSLILSIIIFGMITFYLVRILKNKF